VHVQNSGETDEQVSGPVKNRLVEGDGKKVAKEA